MGKGKILSKLCDISDSMKKKTLGLMRKKLKENRIFSSTAIRSLLNQMVCIFSQIIY